MIYKIVLIRYPFDNLIDFKIRTVLILSEPITKFNHLVTAFITSQKPEITESSDVMILENTNGFDVTGLKQNSVIRLHRLFTIPQELVLKVLDELPSSIHQQINNKLKIIFKLN